MHSPDRHVALRCSFGELQRSMWCAHRGKRAQAHKLAFVLAINLQPAPALSFQDGKPNTAPRTGHMLHMASGIVHRRPGRESTHNALEDAVVQVDDQGAAASRPLWRAGAGGLGRGALLLAQGCGGGGRGARRSLGSAHDGRGSSIPTRGRHLQHEHQKVDKDPKEGGSGWHAARASMILTAAWGHLRVP